LLITPGGDEISPTGQPFAFKDDKVEPYDQQIYHEVKTYQFIEELGRGTQGIVYLYECVDDKRL
jgi:hypothetical protein